MTKSIPMRMAGSTGRQVSRLTVGGVKWDHQLPEADAVELLQYAVELGVTSFDTAHAYGGGESERRLGLALSGRFPDLFISTKTTARTYDEVRDQVKISLERMRTDRVNLVYVHGMDDEEDYHKITGPRGALEALEDCRREGLMDFIGVSGHWYRRNMERLIEAYPVDALLFPIGLFNHAYGHDFTTTVLPAAREKGIATFGMKVFGAGRIKHVADLEPYFRYSVHLPVDSLVIGCDNKAQLEQQVQLVTADLPPLTDDECEALAGECRRVTRDWDKGEYNWVSHYIDQGPLA